ncbi:hypothetical protein CEXT_735541 [Caerostris extrusa]|uniref:50S ribosomal protein L35, chloroplastic n=1 Tax=Caerostris extrusa TaxID=172846 RepID=A0AAV4M3K7_CAEEX|nr:hypothetical protein CEXT_735541 [Caerostris extrusa]
MNHKFRVTPSLVKVVTPNRTPHRAIAASVSGRMRHGLHKAKIRGARVAARSAVGDRSLLAKRFKKIRMRKKRDFFLEPLRNG